MHPLDRDVVSALSTAIRVVTLGQVARTWWPDSKYGETAARRRLVTLEQEGLVMMARAPVHPELAVSGPVASWQPETESPSFGPLSHALKSRWTEHPRMTWLVSATKRAANFFNGHGGRLPREVERSHDVHLAAVYFWYRRYRPEALQYWTFEERIRQERRNAPGTLPDVLLRSPECTRVIECGGAYSKAKLEHFHEYCRERGWAYEIW